MTTDWEERAHRIEHKHCGLNGQGELWLGDIWAASCPSRWNVVAVVNCAPTQVKRCDEVVDDENYLEIDLQDAFIEGKQHDDASVHFEASSSFIEGHLKRGNSVLVHCAGGVSRSATIVIAFVMKCWDLTLDESFHLVRRCRPVIGCNAGFMNQLLDYEKRLYGTETMVRPLNAHQRNFFSIARKRLGQLE